VTGGEQLHCAMQSRTSAEQYELLRTAALGTTLPPEARSGLTILLHRGMWAWVRASLPGATRQPSASVLPPVSIPVTDKVFEQRTVVHLLATMALAVSERRTA
jgi:hypothetical protein